MSILIKGIDMPKDIDELRLIINGMSIAIEPTEVIQISTPHGRLIDADALFEAMGLDTVKEVMFRNWKFNTAWGVPIIEAEEK